MATILILSFTGEPAQQEETTRQTLFFFPGKLDSMNSTLPFIGHREQAIGQQLV
jgi:hypothetical protein